MSALTDLQALLEGAGLDVDASQRAIAYGTDGRVWVLLDSYDVDDAAGVVLDVVAAVSPGHDIAALSSRVWDVMEASDAFTPVAADWVYGGKPISGRDMPQADYATISVVSGRRL